MNQNKMMLVLFGTLITIIIGLFYYIQRQNDLLQTTLKQLQYNQLKAKDGNNRDPYKEIAVNNSLKKIAPKIQTCFNAFIETKPPKTDGFIEIDWIILADGKVKKAELISSDLKTDAFAPCILKAIKEIEFPPPPLSTETYMTYKYHFKKSE